MASVVSDNMLPESAQPSIRDKSAAVLHWASVALVVTVWSSATLFGLYILAFYAGALTDGGMNAWNMVLPKLYEGGAPAATTAIGLHFAAGGIILVLGCVQLSVRFVFVSQHCTVGLDACT